MATMEKANKAAERLSKVTNDSYKTFIDHTVALQERNVRFAQGVVNDTTQEIRHQAESNQALTQELVERAEKQRDAFQTLVEESVDSYMDFVYAPFSYYKQGLRLVENNEAKFAIPNYDDLNVGEISQKLDALSAEQVRQVREYEKKNKNRDTLIEQFDRKLKSAS
jgi:hypothetical protein